MGRVVAAVGIRGEVRVKTFTEEPDGLAGFGRWVVRTPQGWREMPLEDFALRPNGWMRLARINPTKMFAVTVMTVGLGTLLGVALRDTRLVTMTGLNASVYLFFLGGGFTTVAFLPYWLQVASRFIPTSYAIEGLRQALFYPDLHGFRTDLAVLTGSAILSVLLASIMLSRAWRRA